MVRAVALTYGGGESTEEVRALEAIEPGSPFAQSPCQPPVTPRAAVSAVFRRRM